MSHSKDTNIEDTVNLIGCSFLYEITEVPAANMGVVTIFHVTVVTFLLAEITCITGQHLCPLQCHCDDSDSKRGMVVKCEEPSFSELPIFPRSTTYIQIKGKSKVSKIYNGALSGLHDIQTFNLHTDVTWKFESGVFQ